MEYSKTSSEERSLIKKVFELGVPSALKIKSCKFELFGTSGSIPAKIERNFRLKILFQK
jgi:hypothetical protein